MSSFDHLIPNKKAAAGGAFDHLLPGMEEARGPVRTKEEIEANDREYRRAGLTLGAHAADTFALGIPGRASGDFGKYLKESEAENPLSADFGTGIGTALGLSKYSPAGAVAGLALKGASKIPGLTEKAIEGASYLGGIARNALRTGLAGGTEAAAIQGAQDTAAGDPSLERIKMAAGLGGGISGGLSGIATAAAPAMRGIKRGFYNGAFPMDAATAKEAEKFAAQEAAGTLKAGRKDPSRVDDIVAAMPPGSRKRTLSKSYGELKILDDDLAKTIDEIGVVDGERLNNWNVSSDALFNEFMEKNKPAMQAIRIKAGPDALESYQDAVLTALGEARDLGIRDLQKIKREQAWGNLDDRNFTGSAELPARKAALKDLGSFLRGKIESIGTEFSKYAKRPDLGRKISENNRKQGALIEHIDRVVDSKQPSLRNAFTTGVYPGLILGGVAASQLDGGNEARLGVAGGATLASILGNYVARRPGVATRAAKTFLSAEDIKRNPRAILSLMNALQGAKGEGEK